MQTLIIVLKSTGFVILPFYKYPSLLKNIFHILNEEQSPFIRCEILRLFGCLGALDDFTYKRVLFNSNLDHVKNQIEIRG